jgi:hypothetical protein
MRSSPGAKRLLITVQLGESGSWEEAVANVATWVEDDGWEQQMRHGWTWRLPMRGRTIS